MKEINLKEQAGKVKFKFIIPLWKCGEYEPVHYFDYERFRDDRDFRELSLAEIFTYLRVCQDGVDALMKEGAFSVGDFNGLDNMTVAEARALLLTEKFGMRDLGPDFRAKYLHTAPIDAKKPKRKLIRFEGFPM